MDTGFQRIALLFLALVIGASLYAQTNEQPLPKRWGLELSPVGIGLFRIVQGKVTYAPNPLKSFSTELGLGLLIQPQSTTRASEAFNNDGMYSALMASAAVRQYLWKGLHLEEVINFGRGSIDESKVDGRDYEAFVVFTQTFLGYKLNVLKARNVNLFVMAQGGFGYVPLNTNQWPRVHENSSSLYPLGDLKIGINF